MFISSFNNGNRACNWSNLENLGRLQVSIQGRALERVQTSLLCPESVPRVIETLRLLYGRPEQLLHCLMQKARKTESPRMDRLSTFINFGVFVQQLCDHLIASGLVDHLVNPMLIAELVEKLPDPTKVEWVRYKRQFAAVNLSTFSDILSQRVSEATEATVYSEPQEERRPNRERQERKPKARDNEGFLNTHLGTEQHSKQTRADGSGVRRPCRACNRTDHRIRFCDDFLKLTWEARMKIAEDWDLCLLCLNEHGQTRCRFKGHCNIGSCQERHHPLLHPSSPSAPLSADNHLHSSEQNPVIFRVVPIKIYHDGRSVDVVAFLDEGSLFSLMDSSFADQMKSKGTRRPILVKWTAGMSRMERDSR